MAKGRLTTVVPVHGSKALKLGTIRGILQDIEMTPQEFVDLWDKR
jgi:predicted RNA binding protein YcfA (HicA-like mRNA interferase family)